MKLTPLILGLLLAAGAALPVGGVARGADFSTPPRKDSPSLSDKDRGPGSAPVGPALDSSGRRLLEDTVEILGVAEQKPDASGRRKVTVRVRYALIHYPKGFLSLGFNLKSATKFVRVTDHPVDAGTDEIDLSAAIVPVTRPDDQPFKLYVSLSAEPHPKQWSLLAAVSQVMKETAEPGAKH